MNRAIAGEFGFMRTVDRWGATSWWPTGPSAIAGWGLIAKMDVDEAYAPGRRLRTAAAGDRRRPILALGLAASYLIARQITRPIRRLAATADAIAGGDLDTRHRRQPRTTRSASWARRSTG